MTDLRALSFQHCPRGAMPSAPTNEDRRRIWRDCQPVRLHNGYPWGHLNVKTPDADPAKESK